MTNLPADPLAAAVDRAFAAEAEYARTRKPDGGGHSMPPADQVRRMIGAAEPILAEAVAQKITAHMTEHEPKSRGDLIGGSEAERQRRRTWRRHFGIAARIAAGAFYTDEDKMRLAAEAIGRGEFIGCNPEVPDA